MKHGAKALILVVFLISTLVACGSSDETDGGSVELSANHDGWQQADCWDCHTEEDVHPARGYTPSVNPSYTCVDCHGNNGAPAGHDGETPCSDCHDAPHGDTGFPDPRSCQICHPR